MTEDSTNTPEVDHEPEGDQESSSGSNTTLTILIVAVVALLICGAAAIFFLVLRDDQPGTPTVEATAEAITSPTAAVPETEVDPVWTKIQESGTILVGTSADYPPFEFYTADYQFDGFDIALIRAIGLNLGLDVDISDMAFDGLGSALQVNQIDVAIAAITQTDEREQFVDFSNIYFISEDAVLAAGDSQITVDTADQLATYRIGVQSGTIYEAFVRTDLIETGKMPEDNLHVYSEMNQALAELDAGHIDVVLLDNAPAELAVEEQGFAIVGSGHNRLRIAMAIPQDSFTLRAELNAALAELQAEGVVAELIEEYFGIDPDLLPPIPTPDPSQPTPTPAPPSDCIDSMQWVADLSYDDQNFNNIPQVPAGTAFQKGWRLLNTGTCTWDSNYLMVPTGGSSSAARMGGMPTPVQGLVAPGQTYDMWVDLTAPLAPDTYVEYWSLRNPQGVLFGDRVWVAIIVPGSTTATPVATQTPSPEIAFVADPEVIQQGQCSTLNWTTENVKSVYVYPQGADWREYGVPGSGQQTVCPSTTTTYEMRVVKIDDSVETRRVTVYVIPNADAPQIDRFTVEPLGTIELGECVVISWAVSGDVSTVSIWRNNTVIRPNAPFSGNMQDCPSTTGQFTYKLDASGPGGNSSASQTIYVASDPTPTPPPEATPTAPVPTVVPPTATPESDPIIYTFTVLPAVVEVGQCVTVNWSVGGNTDLIQITKAGRVVLETATLRDSEQDCDLSQIGMVTYDLLATNKDDGSAESQAVVQVVAEGEAPVAVPLTTQEG